MKFENMIKDNENNLSQDFNTKIIKAIKQLSENENLLNDKDAVQLLLDNGIPEKDAIEIILFLPIAFIRHLLPSIKWHDTYVEFINKNESIEKKFTETESFQLIWKVTSDFFKQIPDIETIFKIAGRSAEFNVINPLLNNNPDLKIEDIKLSKTTLIR